jgi:PAS domain S-box-containing protein
MIRPRYRVTRRSPVAVTLVLVAAAASAPSARAHLAADLDDAWRWVRFTTAWGLPSNRVEDVLDAGDGTAWAATNRGLAWFDGYRWVPASGEAPELGQRIDAMARCGPSSVAVVAGGLLLRGGREGYEVVPFGGGPRGLEPRDLVELSSSEVLVASLGEGALVLHTVGPEGPARPFPAPAASAHVAVSRLWPGRAGTILLTTGDAVFRLVAGRWEPALVTRPAWSQVNALVEAEDGRGFASVVMPPATRGAWGWSAAGVPERVSSLGNVPVASMNLGPDGDVLTAYEPGEIRRWHAGEWRRVSTGSADLRGLLFVRFRAGGDLWVGTDRGLFLHRHRSTLWTTWRHDQPDARNEVCDIARTRDGCTWIATAGGVDVRCPDRPPRTIDRIGDTVLEKVTAVAADADGNVWIGSGASFSGAYRWDGTTWRHVGAAEGLHDEHVHAIRGDRRGRLWFLGISGSGADAAAEPGASVLLDGRFTRWGVPEGLPSGRVYAFDEGPDGALWFGTLGGLSRWKDGAFTHWTMAQGLSADRVFCLAVGPDGRAWFGAHAGGVGVIEPDGRPRYVTLADGLPSDEVWDLRFDDGGRLWVATAGGLGCLAGGQWSWFGSQSGLGGLRCWPVRPIGRDVLVGTTGAGVSILDLDELATSPPVVEIQAPLFEGPHLVVRWRAFAWWAEQAPHEVETRWRVDDGAWSPWSAEREATLVGLPAGAHGVQVQARGMLSRSSERGASLRVEVPRPWWMRLEVVAPASAFALSLVTFCGVLLVRRRRDALALRASERRYRLLFHGVPLPMWVYDVETLRFLAVNDAAIRHYGYAREEFLAMDVTRIRPPEDVADFVDHVRNHADGLAVTRTWRHVRKDGSLIEVEITSHAITFAGRRARVVLARDVTEKRQLEEQLRKAHAMEAVGRLAGGVAHDFNNILTVILGNAELLLAGAGGTSPGRELASEIVQAAGRAASLTNQLLAFSRKQLLQPALLDLNAVVAGMGDILRRLLGDGIDLRLDLAPALSAVHADPVQLEQVVLNLVINARDAMPLGGTVTLATQDVEVGSALAAGRPSLQPGRHVRLRVRDTGSGMDEATRRRIFEPFFSTKGVGKGTGLGLSTVLGIVEQSGGTVLVESAPGAGTTFDVYLPAATADAPCGAVTTSPLPSRPVASPMD